MNPISHPTLYTKDSTGKTRIWWMDRDGSLYRTNSGVLDGQIVVSEWKEAKPKNIGKANETNGDTQAIAEIDAKYKKQLKTGYHEDILSIEEEPYVQVMLAKSYKDYKDKIDFTKGEWLLNPKYNGCVSGETLIQTKEFGQKTIKYIVENKLKCSVLSFLKGKKVYKRINNYFLDKKEEKEPDWYEIELDTGEKLKITGEHPVFLPKLDCWRKTKNLSVNDIILSP